MRRLREKFATWIWRMIDPYIAASNYHSAVLNAVDGGIVAKQMVEELANELGLEVTYDSASKEVTVHKI